MVQMLPASTKNAPVEFPEQLGAVFQVQVQLDVARLVDEVDVAVVACKAARSEPSHRPSAHAVCPAGEIALLEGEDARVAVRIATPMPTWNTMELRWSIRKLLVKSMSVLMYWA